MVKSYLFNKLKLKSKQTVSKLFKCSQLGLQDNEAMTLVHKFLNSSDVIEWIGNREKSKEIKQMLSVSPELQTSIESSPKLTFTKSKQKLCLNLALTNGVSVSKYFNCSSDGLGDNKAVSNVQSFLSSPAAIDWINKKSVWQAIGEVSVGPETKYYMDKFDFDVKKDIVMASGVHAVYASNNNTLKISVTENPEWGKTHRYDESYELTANSSSDVANFTAVTMYIKCASSSSVCRSKCHQVLVSSVQSELNGDPIICPGCQQQCSCIKSLCTNCSAVFSPSWLKIDGKEHCNACYRYFMKYKVMRPKEYQTNGSRPHYEHFICGWELKFVLNSQDLKTWKVYCRNTNSFFHQSPMTEPSRIRPNLSTRDLWDQQRVLVKATPKQVLSATNRQTSLHVAGSTDSSDNPVRLHDLSQVAERMKVVDSHVVKTSLKRQDDVPLLGSDWRNTEKLLESNYESVLFFQRGDDDKGRDYHIVFASQESLTHLRKLGQFIGMDVKHDFMAARFKTTCFTYCDEKNIGHAAAFSICNKETEKAHTLSLQILLANVPCEDVNCTHPSELFVYDDSNGFFHFRPCAISNPFVPTIQHDKDSSLQNAAKNNCLQSVLCNFHTLQALRRKITENAQTKLFLRPLETGFKCIMRSWDYDAREALIHNYIFFIQQHFPSNLLSENVKNEFINYLIKYWFNSFWSNSFSAEVLYTSPLSERRNPLIFTDNVTERKFKDIDETYLAGHLNRRMFTFVQKCLHVILPDDDKACKISSEPLKRVGRVYNKNNELSVCHRALNLLRNKHIIKYDFESGWALVESGQKKSFSPEVDDSFYTEFYTMSSEDTQHYEDFVPSFNNLPTIENITESISTDHSYNILSKCKNIISSLDKQAIFIMYDYLHSILPHDFQDNVHSNTHIVNLNLGVCSCASFIIKGQPYLCKHLYACLALKLNITNVDELLQQGTFFSPSHTNQQVKSNVSPFHHPENPVLPCLLQQSHRCSTEEIKMATSGKILSILHDETHLKLTHIPGRLPKRLPHNLGNRRLQLAKEPRYNIQTPDFSQTLDPYKPKVEFPDNSRERHGGRKRNALANRGIKFDKILKQALDSLSLKLKSDVDDISNIDSSIDTSESANTSSLPVRKDKETSKQPLSNVQGETSMISDKPIICTMCVASSKNPYYTCSSTVQLLRHLSRAHDLRLFTCSACMSSNGSVVQFESETHLLKHTRLYHKMVSHPAQSNKSLTIDDEGDSVNISPATELNKLNNVDTELEMNKIIYQKGTPGISNLAKLRKSKLSRKRKASDCLKEETKKRLFKCPVCHKTCGYNPPTILCNKCDQWFHWHCVSIAEAPVSKNWFCLKCQ